VNLTRLFFHDRPEDSLKSILTIFALYGLSDQRKIDSLIGEYSKCHNTLGQWTASWFVKAETPVDFIADYNKNDDGASSTITVAKTGLS